MTTYPLTPKPLGRKTPKDFNHVDKYPLKALAPRTVAKVEQVLRLPSWHWEHNQGREGSCVPHGSSMERAVTNTRQNILGALLHKTVRYDPIWLWNEAKKIDEWPETNPGDDEGTSVRAAYDVLRTVGHRRIGLHSISLNVDGVPVVNDPYEGPPSLDEGVLTNRWATTVDEMRTAIASNLPVTIGVNWYSNFDRPYHTLSGSKPDYIIGKDKSSLGVIRGGHCVCIYGASDRRQAFRVKNSWGKSYPLVWLPYETMQRLLNEDGEAALVTDR